MGCSKSSSNMEHYSNPRLPPETRKISNKQPTDLPDGTVVKNLPANAGDTGLIPGPVRSHMPWSNKARVPQLLSLCVRAREQQRLSPCATTTEARGPRAGALQ